MPVRLDITNRRFGRLVAVRHSTGVCKTKTYWLCKCDCGKERSIDTRSLISGKTTSCGCYMLECRTKHGLSAHPLADTWYKIMDRCYNPNHDAYHNYGGRGIGVCARWHDMALFILDNEGKKSPGLTIDRIDNDRDYSPENCTWSTSTAQGRNRRANVFITFQGKTQCQKAWAQELGIPDYYVSKHLRAGETLDQVIESWALLQARRKKAA
jgi:hypothetical protein